MLPEIQARLNSERHVLAASMLGAREQELRLDRIREEMCPGYLPGDSAGVDLNSEAPECANCGGRQISHETVISSLGARKRITRALTIVGWDPENIEEAISALSHKALDVELLTALNALAKANPDREDRTGAYMGHCAWIATTLRDAGVVVRWDRATERFQRGKPGEYQD